MNSNILVVGDKDTILGFKSIGLEVLFCENNINIKDHIIDSINNGIKIIFYTEDINTEIELIKEKYKNSVYPVFVVIPSLKQENTKGKQYIQDLVVQALGSSSMEK